jgi:hypothetical protein
VLKTQEVKHVRLLGGPEKPSTLSSAITRAQDNLNLSWQTLTDSGAAPNGKLETHPESRVLGVPERTEIEDEQ